jgi:hypothetical protein
VPPHVSETRSHRYRRRSRLSVRLFLPASSVYARSLERPRHSAQCPNSTAITPLGMLVLGGVFEGPGTAVMPLSDAILSPDRRRVYSKTTNCDCDILAGMTGVNIFVKLLESFNVFGVYFRHWLVWIPAQFLPAGRAIMRHSNICSFSPWVNRPEVFAVASPDKAK